MPGPVWNSDDPGDTLAIANNADALLASIVATSSQRVMISLADVLQWHATLYAGCTVPHPDYVAHLRGDIGVTALVDYEVGIGPNQPDGLPERVGVLSIDVAQAVRDLIAQVAAAVSALDAALPDGSRPTTVDELSTVVQLAARIHSEWVRIHPFATGNGRTARVWVAWLCVRYDLPVFVTLKPRPGDIAYSAAARESMGRPPAFTGDHDPTVAVFTHLLVLSLLP